jgi:hypothetical protein
MKKYAACFLLLAGLFFSCAQKKNLVPDEYLSWEQTVKGLLMYPIPGHLNSYRRIFINATGEKVVETADANGVMAYHYPKGTVIIKEVYPIATYNENAKPAALTCMVKDPKNPQSRGGWVWIIKAVPSGKETIIDQPFCVTCHANANEPHPYGDKNKESEFRDYVFFPYENEEKTPDGEPGK